MSTEDEARVGYLISMYPALSHTFIRREIEALERLGVYVLRIALRGWDGQLVHSEDVQERDKTLYVLRAGLLRILGAVIRILFSRPHSLWHAAKLACHMARDSERSLLLHLVYLGEACLIRLWLSEHQVSHLHAHFAHNPAEIAMLTSALGGVKYSFTAHGSDIMNRPAQIGLPYTVNGAEFVATVSSFGRSQICRWIPHSLWERVLVVRCGLEKTYGAISRSSPASASRRFLCVGRFSAEKGQMVLIEALARLADQGVEAQLVLVGDGPMRLAVEELVGRHGLGGLVSVVGSLDARGVQAQIREARALVVPSLSEGLPVVIMEAMAMGRPTIAPFLAGIPELVTDCVNGWLYPAGDSVALARSMRDCLESSDSAIDAMGERAKAAVLAKHDVDKEAALLRSLFARSAAVRAA